MNSERKAFEEAIKKISGGDIKNQINEKNGEYLYGVMQLMWVVWQASTQRQGYKLVPVDKLIEKWKKEAKYREDIASEDWVSNTINECIDDLKAMIGAVDE